jgi:hypothetical protein
MCCFLLEATSRVSHGSGSLGRAHNHAGAKAIGSDLRVQPLCLRRWLDPEPTASGWQQVHLSTARRPSTSATT